MSISGIFFICFLIGALTVAYFHERKHEVKSEEYQETNYCNNFNKQFNKPNFTLVEDGNSFKVGVV